MAKFDSVIKFTGNLDGMVGMKGANGQTYIRKNVKPADPKTESQVETRTKVSLAGQISKLTPSSAILGLAGGKRERRNRFMKLMLKGMTITNSPNNKTAVLPPDKLIFSEGREFPINVDITSTTGVARGVNAKISSDEAARITTAGIESVCIIFVWSEDDVYRTIDVKNVSVATFSQTGVTSLNLLEKCNVYVIPVLPGDGVSRANYIAGVERAENEGYTAFAELIANKTIALGQSQFNGVGTSSQQ